MSVKLEKNLLLKDLLNLFIDTGLPFKKKGLEKLLDCSKVI